ncbi:MAG: winged helix-turn-helix transcriptional regulator [Thermoplasmatota archaeon]
MDLKDLELLTHLSHHGRWGGNVLSSMVTLSEGNIDRRIRLLQKEGYILKFSAFFDRRMFGYDTTYIKAFVENRSRDRIIAGIMNMPQVASVYPNMDDFMIIEVVHWDRSSLKAAVGAVGRLISPMTVTGTYTPKLPDMIPEVPDRSILLLIDCLINDGRADPELVSELTGIPSGDVNERIRRLENGGMVSIRTLIREEEVQPFPCFSIIVTFDDSADLSTGINRVNKVSKGVWHSEILMRPAGIWLRCFGEDLYAMDDSLERLRRIEYVRDVMVILPDGVEVNRSVDRNILKRYIDHGPEAEMAL